MNRKLESLQRRALTTMLGRAAAPGARVNGRALEVVFGELSMKDRRWLDPVGRRYKVPRGPVAVSALHAGRALGSWNCCVVSAK